MTREQERAIAIAKRLAEKLGRRPNGAELNREKIATGRRQAFMTLQALLEAAGLAVPAPPGHAGLTPREEGVFLRMWEEGATRKAIGEALGISVYAVGTEVFLRKLTRGAVRGPGPDRVDETSVTRRCQECWGQTKGLGQCQICGAAGNTEAA